MLYVEINCFCIVILVLIFFNIYYRTDHLPFDLKLFIGLIAADALILITDALTWALDGRPGIGGLLTFATFLYYVLNPVICLLWYLYVDFFIHKDTARLKKRLFPMLIPAAIILILSVLSLFGDYLFYIDGNNVYHRGKLFILLPAIAFFYILYVTFFAVRYRKLIRKQDLIPIYFFMMPAVIGTVFQSMYYGLSLIWPLVTLSILNIFIRLQNRQLYTDHLTGLFNRRQLERYLYNNMQNADGTILAGLMIDLDSFKKINDVHGHDAGDQALIDTSEILKKTFRKNDLVARYGGDEFIVVMEILQKSDLDKAVKRLNANVAQFNNRKAAPYTISLSVGYDFYMDKTKKDIKDFIKHLDDLMYKDKHGNAINQNNSNPTDRDTP